MLRASLRMSGVKLVEDGETCSPSESWDDMGRVVERMRELGWTLAIYVGPTTVTATFDPKSAQFEGTAETAPLAVCRAALKALEGE